MSRRAIAGLAIAGVILIAGVISGQGRLIQSQPSLTIFPVQDPSVECGLGNTPGCRVLFIFGVNDSVGATEDDLWDGNGVYAFYPTTAVNLECASTDAADTSAGTGARSLLVEGLDSTFGNLQEVVAMNGVTPVSMANSYRRVLSISVVTAGSSKTNEGTIFCESPAGGGGIPAGDGVPSADDAQQISVGISNSLNSSYTISSGKTGIIKSMGVHAGKGDEIVFRILIRFNNSDVGDDGAFITGVIISVFESPFIVSGGGSVSVGAGTDIRMTARKVSGGGTSPSIGFYSLLLQED